MFYVAIRNDETGRYELSWNNGMSKADAEQHLVNCLSTGASAMILIKADVLIQATVKG
jgi:hypothetical protein